MLTLDASHDGLGLEAQGRVAEGRLNQCQRGSLGKWAKRGSRERANEIIEWEGKGHLRSLALRSWVLGDVTVHWLIIATVCDRNRNITPAAKWLLHKHF